MARTFWIADTLLLCESLQTQIRSCFSFSLSFLEFSISNGFQKEPGNMSENATHRQMKYH